MIIRKRPAADGAAEYSFSDLDWEMRRLWIERYREDSDRDRNPAPIVSSGSGFILEQDERFVRLGTAAGKGKITDAGYDQFAFCAVSLPDDADFCLSAAIRVKRFPPGHALAYQEGFGVFLRDTLALDPTTGYPYANMAAVGGYYGCFNVFGRCGLEADDIGHAGNFFLRGKEPPSESGHIGSGLCFHLTLAREGGQLLARMTDENGASVLKITSDGPVTGTPGLSVDEDGCCMMPMARDTFSRREPGLMYLGFMAAQCEIEIDKRTVLLKVSPGAPVLCREIFAAPDGRPGAAGTREDPWDLATAVAVHRPGQAIFVQPGAYRLEGDLPLPSGPGGLYCPGGPEDRAVLDFGGRQNALRVDADDWTLEGLTVTRGLGIQISGSRNTLRRCTARENLETGILIRCPDNDAREEDWPSFNTVEDCISFCNIDPPEKNADGFACKVTAGTGNRFLRCRAWLNSDDGFDLFAKNRPTGAVLLEDCESCLNGYAPLPDGTLRRTAGNGNGFKLGGSGQAADHRAHRCRAVGNAGYGFTSNSNPRMELVGCRAENNGKRGIEFYFTGQEAVMRRVILDSEEYCEDPFVPSVWWKEHRRELEE